MNLLYKSVKQESMCIYLRSCNHHSTITGTSAHRVTADSQKVKTQSHRRFQRHQNQQESWEWIPLAGSNIHFRKRHFVIFWAELFRLIFRGFGSPPKRSQQFWKHWTSFVRFKTTCRRAYTRDCGILLQVNFWMSSHPQREPAYPPCGLNPTKVGLFGCCVGWVGHCSTSTFLHFLLF